MIVVVMQFLAKEKHQRNSGGIAKAPVSWRQATKARMHAVDVARATCLIQAKTCTIPRMQRKHAISGRARGRLPLAREGWPFIILIAAFLLLFIALSWWAAVLLDTVLLVFILNFFRDPDRNTPSDPCAFIAPADGRVIRSESIDGVWRVDIFMNVFNVHVNRAPMAGRITHMHYFPGVFVNASFDKASEHNERNRFTLLGDCGISITFTQIAGLIARRIVSYVAVGDHVEAGQRIGMIRFGSRVDCRIPEGFDACVAVGDVVVAGESILARRTVDA